MSTTIERIYEAVELRFGLSLLLKAPLECEPSETEGNEQPVAPSTTSEIYPTALDPQFRCGLDMVEYDRAERGAA